MPARKKEEQQGTPEVVVVHRLEMGHVDIPIRGVTPLITNPWTTKAKDLLRKSQGIGVKKGAAKTAREAKNIDEEIEERLAVYRLPDGRNGFPATAFKAAMVRAAKVVLDMDMTMSRLLFHVTGTEDDELVAIEGEPKVYENFPRNANGNPDIRYRPIFYDWSAVLRVSFVQSRIDPQSVYNLVDHAGQMVGVGEWRPGSKISNTGSFGRFMVE